MCLSLNVCLEQLSKGKAKKADGLYLACFIFLSNSIFLNTAVRRFRNTALVPSV